MDKEYSPKGLHGKPRGETKEYSRGMANKMVSYCEIMLDAGYTKDFFEFVERISGKIDPVALFTVERLLESRIGAGDKGAKTEGRKGEGVDYTSGTGSRLVEDIKRLVDRGDRATALRALKALINGMDPADIGTEELELGRRIDYISKHPYGFRKENPPGYG